MSKTNFFVKHLKNINNFINNLLEKNLNKLNFKNLSFLFKNNKQLYRNNFLLTPKEWKSETKNIFITEKIIGLF